MRYSKRWLAWTVLGLGSVAQAAPFEFPASLPGFTARPGLASFRYGGPIDRVLKEKDLQCPQVGIYDYTDGVAATAGLREWLTRQNLQATEHDRSDTMSLWTVQTDDVTLIGTWLAPASGQPGRLEMCAATPLDDERAARAQGTHIRVPMWLILGMLGAVGTLGSKMGPLTDRLRGHLKRT